MRESVAADLRTVFNADKRAHADERLDTLVQKYRKSTPELSAWMENAIPEALQVFSLPDHKRKKNCAHPT
jgi:transposase-like protein